MTLFSNRISFLDFDGNFEKKNFEIFFSKNAPGLSGAYAKGFRSISQLLPELCKSLFFCHLLSQTDQAIL